MKVSIDDVVCGIPSSTIAQWFLCTSYFVGNRDFLLHDSLNSYINKRLRRNHNVIGVIFHTIYQESKLLSTVVLSPYAG